MDSIITMTSPNVLEASVVVGLSSNLEASVVGELPSEVLSICPPHSKVLVRDVEDVAATPGGVAGFMVVANDSNSTNFFVPTPDGAGWLAAGSSINVGFVLKLLGANDISIVSAVGEGAGADSLIRPIQKMGFGMLFFKSQGTSRTVSLRSPTGQGTTLLCAKRGYQIPPDYLRSFASASPNVLALTGVKPMDLPGAKALAKSQAKKIAVVPHRETITDPETRVEFVKEIVERCSLLQLNVKEAATLLGKQRFECEEDMPHLSALGPEIVIVTMGRGGVLARVRDLGLVIRQEAFPVEKVVDTCGAGDVLLASLIYYHWLHHVPIEASMRVSAWIAAQKVGHVGPWSGIPVKEEREQKLAQFRAELGE